MHDDPVDNDQDYADEPDHDETLPAPADPSTIPADEGDAGKVRP